MNRNIRHSGTRRALLPAALLLGILNTGQAAEPTRPVDEQVADLKAENERLRTLIPSQSHAMVDVAYHFTNLWFAGKEQNWPLAQFYFNEARNHIVWAVRLVPVRKVASGDLALQPIFDAFDKGQLAEIKQAIADRSTAKFAAAYEGALGGCNGCHTAVEKPFLRVVKPQAPEVQIIALRP